MSTASPALCGTAAVARGLAVGDVDNDGALDLLVTNMGGPARLYRNVAPDRGNWLVVKARLPKLKRDAYGALVTVRAGDRTWQRIVNPGWSYLCSNDPRVHFGLGNVKTIDAIRVAWPDGTEEEFDGGATNRHITLALGSGKAVQR
jgi:hypothetical protein